MAKMAICDVCDKKEPLDPSYATVPPKWYTLRQRLTDEQHLCSLDCVEKAVAQMRGEVIASVLATTAP